MGGGLLTFPRAPPGHVPRVGGWPGASSPDAAPRARVLVEVVRTLARAPPLVDAPPSAVGRGPVSVSRVIKTARQPHAARAPPARAGRGRRCRAPRRRRWRRRLPGPACRARRWEGSEPGGSRLGIPAVGRSMLTGRDVAWLVWCRHLPSNAWKRMCCLVTSLRLGRPSSDMLAETSYTKKGSVRDQHRIAHPTAAESERGQAVRNQPGIADADLGLDARVGLGWTSHLRSGCSSDG